MQKNKRIPWLDEDVATLVAFYMEGKTSTKEIASSLNKTPHAIRDKAWLLGLRRFHPEDAVNANN